MNICYKYFLLGVGCIYLLSCNNAPSKNHGPIILGDSSTIVTEADPRRLQDLVTDLTPDIPTTTAKDSAKNSGNAAVKDTSNKPPATVATQTPPPAALPAGQGLRADFREVTFLIPGISAKIAGNANLEKANGAVYTLNGTAFTGNMVRTTGNVSKVSLRYQSIVILRSKNGILPLDNLTETTSWAQIKGGNGSYPITGLNEAALEYPTANNSAIKNAVNKVCNRRHLTRKRTQEWLNMVSNVKAANQAPLVVTLRSIMWKVDGKDDKGKIYSKQIRVDVPM